MEYAALGWPHKASSPSLSDIIESCLEFMTGLSYPIRAPGSLVRENPMWPYFISQTVSDTWTWLAFTGKMILHRKKGRRRFKYSRKWAGETVSHHWDREEEKNLKHKKDKYNLNMNLNIELIDKNESWPQGPWQSITTHTPLCSEPPPTNSDHFQPCSFLWVESGSQVWD